MRVRPACSSGVSLRVSRPTPVATSRKALARGQGLTKMQLRRNRTTLEAPAESPPKGVAAPDAAGNGEGPIPFERAITNGGGEPPKRSRPRLKKLRVALVLFGLSILAFVSWIFGIMAAVAQDLPQLEDRAQFANAKNSV